MVGWCCGCFVVPSGGCVMYVAFGVTDFVVVLFMLWVGCGCMFYCVLVSVVTFVNSVVLCIIVVYYVWSVLLGSFIWFVYLVVSVLCLFGLFVV